MRTMFTVLAAALLFAAPAGAQTESKPAEKPTTGKVGEKIPEFTGKIARGEKTADFDSRKTGKTTVYFLVGVTCPATGPYVPRLIELEKAYTPKDVDFVYLYVNKTEPIADKQKFHKEHKLAGGFFNDEGSAVAKKLGASKTGLALIVDKEGNVLYRGGIDDNLLEPAKVKTKFVVQALDEVLAGKKVTKTEGQVFG